MLEQLQQILKAKADPENARLMTRFFKTEPGEYAEGDRFMGIKVPILRKLAKSYSHLSFADLYQVIASPYHEQRLIALFILLEKYKRTDRVTQKDAIYKFYVVAMEFVNNWDLVDVSAPHIAGDYLYARDRSALKQWAQHGNMWYRRIAIVATLHFIRQDDFSSTLALTKILLRDKEDLIHKAMGWMLREVGKRDSALLEDFIMQHYVLLPRTTLRYAIERFPELKRKRFLNLNQDNA